MINYIQMIHYRKYMLEKHTIRQFIGFICYVI